MTAQPFFDGTFSTDAVAAAAAALVARLHDEAMATIAELADTWDQPVEAVAAVDADAVTYTEPATWSVVDDEDEVRVVPLLDLPALLPRPRPAASDVTALVEPRMANVALATATTDEFAAARDDREFVAL